MKKLVLVYGILMNSDIGNKIDEGIYTLPFSMFDLGRFPALVPKLNFSQIKGQIYEVEKDTIKRLDAYEGYPHLYQKYNFDLPLATDTNKTKRCVGILYYMKSSVLKKLLPEAHLIESGDWANYHKNRVV